ncbi:hypothetical protein K3495_g11480 [Podosphaera aphanis]|nr:hypothetical protein K3495_g11480 [Podosphaera aphanis]
MSDDGLLSVRPGSATTLTVSIPKHLPATNISPAQTRNAAFVLPDAAAALAGPESLDIPMELGKSNHRRRRSLMNYIDAKKNSTKPNRKRGEHQNLNRRSENLDSANVEIIEEGNTSEDVALSYLSDDALPDDEETALTGRDKNKREQRKRRSTLLGQRIASDPLVTEDERKEADNHVVKKSLINILLIALWYIFSLSISIYNKWMFDIKHLDFHFPLFTTCLHMLVQFSLSSLTLYLLPQYRPRYNSISNPQNMSQVTDADILQHQIESQRPLMTRFFYFTRIGPCGVATGLDIGLGNMSLKFITLTFYTMCKSSSLSFVLLFAFIFRLETPSIRLVLIIATMTLGVLMMVAGETTFSPLGFILVILAAFFSGFRWGLTQILLLRNPATSNPFSSIFYLAPIMFFSLLLLAIPVEGFSSLVIGLERLIEDKGPILGPLLLLFPGTIAFCMTASEFALLQRTSVVTLSIAGIFKEVVTITAAGLVFHDPLTPTNISGLIVTLSAIAAYNYIKIRHMREDAQEEVRKSKLGHNEDSNSESGAEDSEDEWHNNDLNYVTTTDGDILPLPDSSSSKRIQTSRKERNASDIRALAASKKELSD